MGVYHLASSERGLEIRSSSARRRAEADLSVYLRASDDLSMIQADLRADRVLAYGIERVRGLRLVKMDEWECLISYVLATYANIPRISAMIESISMAFGEEISGGAHAFPTVGGLRGASVKELAACGLGYRSNYIHDICHVVSPKEIEAMKRLEFGELREALMELPGVGDKVADCVALFGFGHLEAFPVDVWVRRALARLYGIEGSYGLLQEFARQRFGRFAGYAQEYLYFNERTLASAGRCAFSEE